ncbi:MAG TPA: aspartate aminotransferase family protein [Candidatus Sulfotelmatobacter sp.]|nr:aspartate aminotransferase family protein [Candidatus Sulfotelmatobacter sp.]
MTSAVMPTYQRAAVAFSHGEGCRLTDRDGRRYLDFAAGIAVCVLGHAHPRLTAALTAQAARLWHCSNLFEIPGQEKVAARLAALSFGELVFFGNSGAEANEAAIKIARRHHAAAGHPERWRIVAFEGSFHGRTLATLAAAGNPKNLAGFGPPVAGFDHAPYGDLDAAARLVGPETAAILVEPIQGDGGVRVPPPGFLAGLRALADCTGALLMFDEIQTGIGRTGTLFAHQRLDVAPDVMTLAKALGGGFPIGACVATRRAAGAMTAGSHASTFGGNPLAVAVADAVLEVVTAPGFLAAAESAGVTLAAGLDALVARRPAVFEARRGIGLMQSLRCRAAPAPLVERLLQAGLVVAPANDQVIRLLPPLIVSSAEIEEALGILDTVAAAGA